MARPSTALTLLAAALVAGAFAVTATPAGGPTYTIHYLLAGTYTETQSYDQAGGFCDGTGQTESSTFDLVASGRIAVGTRASVTGSVSPFAVSPGEWKVNGKTISSGDDCTAMKTKVCNGDTQVGNVRADPVRYFVQRVGNKVGIARYLPAIVEKSALSDCDANQDYYPAIQPGGLGRVLQPYAW